MMGFEFPGGQKKCATCSHWTGTRKLVRSKTTIEVDSPSARGGCSERTRGGRQVSANQTCSMYRKWPELKL